MKDVKIPCMPNLIMRLLSGGTLRRAAPHQEAVKKRGESLLTLDLIRRPAPRVHKD